MNEPSRFDRDILRAWSGPSPRWHRGARHDAADNSTNVLVFHRSERHSGVPAVPIGVRDSPRRPAVIGRGCRLRARDFRDSALPKVETPTQARRSRNGLIQKIVVCRFVSGNPMSELSLRCTKSRVEPRRRAPVARERLGPARGVATTALAAFTRARSSARKSGQSGTGLALNSGEGPNRP